MGEMTRMRFLEANGGMTRWELLYIQIVHVSILLRNIVVSMTFISGRAQTALASAQPQLSRLNYMSRTLFHQCGAKQQHTT